MKSLNQLSAIPSVGYSLTGLSFDRPIPFEEWAAIGATLDTIERGVNWWIGDWVNYGERQYGEKYTQAIHETGRKRQSIANLAWVAGQFTLSRRRDNLSWSHHEAVASLDPGTQDRLFDEAEVNGWSHREMREAAQRTKKEIPQAGTQVRLEAPPREEPSQIIPEHPGKTDAPREDPEPEDEGFDELIVELERIAEENVRLVQRNQELEAEKKAAGGDIVAHLQKKLEEEREKWRMLEGRLHGEIEKANELQRKAKYQSDLLARIRKILRVDSNGEIESAIHDLTR